MDILNISSEQQEIKVSKKSTKYPFYVDFSLGSKLLFLLSIFNTDKAFFFSNISLFGKDPEIKRGQFHVRVEGCGWGDFQNLQSLEQLTIWKDMPIEGTRSLVEFTSREFVESERQRIVDKRSEILMLVKVLENLETTTSEQKIEGDVTVSEIRVPTKVTENITKIQELSEERNRCKREYEATVAPKRKSRLFSDKH